MHSYDRGLPDRGRELSSALSAAADKTDGEFVTHIGALLNAAGKPRFRPLRNEIYSGLLMRYIAMRSQPVHPDLRDALVTAWKNPWLARNDSAWARVPYAARKLVSSRLKLDLIHQVFECFPRMADRIEPASTSGASFTTRWMMPFSRSAADSASVA